MMVAIKITNKEFAHERRARSSKHTYLGTVSIELQQVPGVTVT